MTEKTHYRKAFNSPYLSSEDIVDPISVTIDRVVLEKDKTNKTRDSFNTAYFVEKEIRPGEALKPMILNVHNSKVMAKICDSKYIDDWTGVTVTIYVEHGIKFGRDTVDGLRLMAGSIFVSEEQAAELTKTAKEVEADFDGLLKWAGCKTVDKFPVAKFRQAIGMLEKKRK